MISNADLSEERNEYNAALSAFYEPRFTGVAGDVAFYVAQAQAAGSPALELAARRLPHGGPYRGAEQMWTAQPD
jgi:hypothetical protein